MEESCPVVWAGLFAFSLVEFLWPFLLMLVMLWWWVSTIFFIVICRSISDMVVPFNLYSLGYFLKQFTEHYLNWTAFTIPWPNYLSGPHPFDFGCLLCPFAFPLILLSVAKENGFCCPFLPTPLSVWTVQLIKAAVLIWKISVLLAEYGFVWTIQFYKDLWSAHFVIGIS